MKVGAINFLIAIALGLSLSSARYGNCFAKDKALTPEEVVSAHLKSIGPLDFLTSIKTRGVRGKASVEFIQGGVGTQAGSSMVISSGPSLSIILKYGSADYPGEYFAFDGTDVDVANITPGQRSPLGDFIFRYKGLMKEGLLGGVLSLGWPLLDIDKRNASLKYSSAKVDGRKLHEIDYAPKGGLNEIKVKMFFEPDTFRHVRTEYMLRVRGEQPLQAGKTITREAPNTAVSTATGQVSGSITRDAGILDRIGDSYYRLVEKFDDFREIRFKNTKESEPMSLILPHSYSLEYSVEGQGSSFLARWNLVADQWMQNGTINPAMFKVH